MYAVAPSATAAVAWTSKNVWPVLARAWIPMLAWIEVQAGSTAVFGPDNVLRYAGLIVFPCALATASIRMAGKTISGKRFAAACVTALCVSIPFYLGLFFNHYALALPRPHTLAVLLSILIAIPVSAITLKLATAPVLLLEGYVDAPHIALREAWLRTDWSRFWGLVRIQLIVGVIGALGAMSLLLPMTFAGGSLRQAIPVTIAFLSVAVSVIATMSIIAFTEMYYNKPS